MIDPLHLSDIGVEPSKPLLRSDLVLFAKSLMLMHKNFEILQDSSQNIAAFMKETITVTKLENDMLAGLISEVEKLSKTKNPELRQKLDQLLTVSTKLATLGKIGLELYEKLRKG